MDVVLGVAVTGRVARLAMIGSPASGGQVLDQYALDLPDGAPTDLADTIVGTYRAVADSGNRMAAIRLCVPDASQAETLRQTVLGAGAQNVEVVAETEAAAALARSVGADAALLLADDDTVALTVVGEDEESTSVLASAPIGAAGAAVACAAVLQNVPSAEAPVRIMLVGQRLDLDSVAAELRSTAPVEVPPDAGYAIARGAAQTAEESGYPAGAATMMAPAAADATMMAPAAGDATQMAPAAADATQMAPTTDPSVVGPQLAYSEEGPGEYEMPFDSLDEFVPELEDEEAYTALIEPPPRKTVLMGSALAFVVVSFATLAVTVAINIRPVADVEAQPVPAIQAETVPGRFLPQVPHEPDPVALPVAVVSPAPAAPAPNVPINRGPNSVAPQAPAPQAPPAPAPVPGAPVVPIPPVIPFPPFNPFPTLPTFTTTVTTTPTTTTTTPTTTTTTPTTTTTTPTTTTTETTTSTSEPTTIPVSPVTPVIPKTELPATQAPAYTPAPPYTPPAPVEPVAPAPVVEQPAPVVEQPAPVIEKPAPVIEAPVTTIPVSP